MPRRISGRFVDIIHTLGTSPEDNVRFLVNKGSHENATKIGRDLPRTALVDGTGHTLDDFKHHCQTQAVLAEHYRQGNYDGGSAIDRYFAYFMIKVVALHAKMDQLKKDPQTQEAIQEEANAYQNLWTQNLKHLRFAYRDDDGVLCGFGLAFRKDKPGTWVLDITKNTTAPLDQRISTSFSNGELALKEATSVSKSDLPQALQVDLNSKFVNQLLEGLIDSRGEISLEKFEALDSQIKTNHNLDKQTYLDNKIKEAIQLAPNNQRELGCLVNEIQGGIKHNPEFFYNIHFESEIRNIDAFVYFSNQAEFKQKIENLKNSSDMMSQELYQRGQVVLTCMKDFQRNHQDIPYSKLTQIMVCSINHIENPGDEANKARVIRLLEDPIFNQKSNPWEKLRGALLMFLGAVMLLTGAAMVVAGCLTPLSIVVIASGVGLAAAGAFVMDEGHDVWQGAKKKGEPKSPSNYSAGFWSTDSKPTTQDNAADATSDDDSGYDEDAIRPASRSSTGSFSSNDK